MRVQDLHPQQQSDEAGLQAEHLAAERGHQQPEKLRERAEGGDGEERLEPAAGCDGAGSTTGRSRPAGL